MSNQNNETHRMMHDQRRDQRVAITQAAQQRANESAANSGIEKTYKPAK